MTRSNLFLIFISIIHATDLVAAEDRVDFDFSAIVEPEIRGFVDRGSAPEQSQYNLSLSAEAEFEWSWGRDRALVVNPFLRLDQNDPHRTHFDLREANYTHVFPNNWEILVGVERIFWGVAESVHVIDIVNQTDQVENVDDEDALGQPMVKLGIPTQIGLLEFYYLPYFRERTFASRAGRPRLDFLVDVDNPLYESPAEEWNQDFAFRWSHFVGPVDIGLSHFSGTGRDPIFIPQLILTDITPTVVLIPFYPQIQQTSVDVQGTFGPALLKFEGFTRNEAGQRYYQAIGGIEYTLYQIGGTAGDLGLLAEYVYDSRGTEFATTPFANDLFVGARWALNNEQSTTLLGGGLTDLETAGMSLFIEAETRFRQNYFVSLEARLFANVDSGDLLAQTRDDGFIQLRIQRFF